MTNIHKDSVQISGSGEVSSRSTLKWCLPFFAAFLPIVLISFYSYRISSESVQSLLKTEHLAATSNLSQLLMEDLSEGVNLVHAVASVPGTIDAVKERDRFAIRARLKAVTVAYPQVDSAYVTYPDGILWEEHPQNTQFAGADLSRTEWYTNISEDWKSYISGIYRRSTRDKPAIAIAAPIKDSDGTVLGILVFEYPTTQIVQWLQNIGLSHQGYLMVLDHNGTLIAHPDSKPDDPLYTSYNDVVPVQDALQGVFHTGEYVDPLFQTKMIATFQPVSAGRNLWIIVAQQPTQNAYIELKHVTLNIGLVGGIMTIFTLMMVIAVARIDARNIRLNKQLQDTNLQLKELASIVHFSSDAIVGLALDGIITSWNESAEEMYGYSAEEMIGHSIASLVPEDRREELGTLLDTIQSGEGVEAFETERVRKDGTHIPVSITISTIDDGDETIVAASSIDRDITERMEVEQMKSDFISFVTHQLKAPVTAMRWILEQVLDGDFGDISPELKDAMQDLQVVNADNYRLITDILNVSRINRGVIAVDLQPISLQEIAEESVRDYRIAIQKANLTLTFENPEQEIIVLADKEKMAEAVANSISNAIKHTEKGGITIRLKQEGANGIIEVADTGAGISPAILGKLFTRNQILGGGASAESSAGIGLYIASNFMKLQNGNISVQSTLGEGSTFIYHIPLALGQIDGETAK